MRTDSKTTALIGFAILWPIFPTQVSSFAFLLVSELVKTALQRSGVDTTGMAGVFGPGFVVITAVVPHQETGLGVLRGVADSLGLIEDACEIAFFDVQHQRWETVHPQPAPKFERFLTQANVEAAMRAANDQQRETDLAFAQFCGGKPDGRQ
jgi:hypothetical protein